MRRSIPRWIARSEKLSLQCTQWRRLGTKCAHFVDLLGDAVLDSAQADWSWIKQAPPRGLVPRSLQLLVNESMPRGLLYACNKVH